VNFTLRTKAVAAGCGIAIVVASVASYATFLVARRYLIDQRESSATSQSMVAARQIARSLSEGAPPLDALLAASRLSPTAGLLVRVDGTWLTSAVGISGDDIPAGMTNLADERIPSRQRTTISGRPALIVSIPVDVPDDPTALVARISWLTELERSLFAVRTALLVGVALAAGGGGLVALWLSRRISEPLRAMSTAASAISGGDLDAHVVVPREPDLAAIARSFNVMADSLAERFRRERQFAGHVSHELRSPLTVIIGAADAINERAGMLDDHGARSAQVLSDAVREFEKILSDLIEISRYETNSVSLQIDEYDLNALLATLASRHLGGREHLVEDADGTEGVTVLVDARRASVCFKNLVDNADRYGRGLSAVRTSVDAHTASVHVDDAGRGVPRAERSTIFEPFTRGSRTAGTRGSGLGLTIVREHVRVMGGRIELGTSPEGGARFSLVLPRAEAG